MARPHRFLWLLRHAKTVTDPPEGGSDFDRVLAPRGRRDAEALGHLLGLDPPGSALGLGKVPLPDLALVSPAARTVATADLVLGDLVLGDLDRPPTRRLVDALYGAEPDDVLDQLRGVPDEVAAVMVVGHNPTAHALAQGLIARADKKGRDLVNSRGFPTCSLGIYRFSADHWAEVSGQSARLVSLLTPPFAKN